MARYTGKELVVLFNGHQLEADFRSFDPDESITIVDASAGDDVAKYKLTGQEDGAAAFSGLGQTGATGTAWWGYVAKGTRGTLEWAPEGTASTKPRHYVADAVVESRAQSHPYEDVVEVTVNWTFSSAVVDTAYA